MTGLCHRPQTKRLMALEVLLTFLLLLLRQIIGGGAQVASEPCTYNTPHTVANCSSRQFEFVPWRLHKSIITLDLSGNNFPTLANQSFISYKYINNLFLKNNSIHTIESRAFHLLAFLDTLDLSNNKLTLVPSAALEPVAQSLHQLIMSGNKIQVIQKGVFANFVQLQHLDLSGNSVYRVEYGAFKGLRAMQEFKIRHNALAFLPSDSFDDFPPTIYKVQLYDNRWFCDCKMRWLRQWLNNTPDIVWESSGYAIRCDGPSIVREKPLDSLPMDELACEIQMKTSSSTHEVAKGANTSLLCKYSSIPDAEAKWLKNTEIIDVQKHSHKYSVEANIVDSHQGERTQKSELKIRDFDYDDIAKYECFVQNIRGVASTEYRLTLVGIKFEGWTTTPSVNHLSSSIVDTRSIVVAVAVVCGLILIIVVSVLIFCSVNRVQRKRQAKQDAIVENVKQHFINNR